MKTKEAIKLHFGDVTLSVTVESLLTQLFLTKFEENSSTFGSFIKNLRIDAEVEPQDAAQALGIDRNTFSRVEDNTLLLNENIVRGYATKLARVSGIAKKIVDMVTHFDNNFTEILEKIAKANNISYTSGARP